MERDIGALNEEMDAAGARIFAGGLSPASNAKSLRAQPDGKKMDHRRAVPGDQGARRRFLDPESRNLEEALEWGRKAVIACRVPVEVRPFLRIRPQRKAGDPGS